MLTLKYIYQQIGPGQILKPIDDPGHVAPPLDGAGFVQLLFLCVDSWHHPHLAHGPQFDHLPSKDLMEVQSRIRIFDIFQCLVLNWNFDLTGPIFPL